MKKVMMMAWTAAAVGLFAAPAKQSLVATAEIAPFADITPAVTALGSMMNNPMLPTLAIGMAQQGLAQNYGRLRTASPMFLQVYLADDVVQNLNLEKLDALKDKGDAVMVYPIDETEEAFLQKRGAQKAADGTIHLAKSETRPQERWAKFTADGKFCAFAQSPALAARAVEDFAQRPAPKPGAKSHLLRVSVREPGVVAMLGVLRQVQAKQETELLAKTKDNRQFIEKVAAFKKLQSDVQQKILGSFAGATLVLDLDDYGISVGGVFRRKPGVNVAGAGASLPAGALDLIPAGANLFGAYNRLSRLDGDCADAADFAKLQRALVDLLQDLAGAVANEAAKNQDLKKYEGLVKDVIAAASELAGSFAYPQKGDWDSFALGFDAQKHPAILGGGNSATAAAEGAAARKFLDRVLGAFQRQWPAQKFFLKRADCVYAIDWAAFVDFLVAECQLVEKAEKPKDAAKVKQDAAKAKKYLVDILGGTTTEFAVPADGKTLTMATPGVKVATGAGEARFAAAIPEVAKARPAGVFYCTPYALVRDVVMPLVGKFADEAEALQQVKALQAALPPASSKGALAGASWMRNDGSVRFLFRLTADEVKSLGGAVGALSAASADDDDDDDDDNQ